MLSAGTRVGAALLLLSAPVAAWWMIGDLSESSPGADYYALKPLRITFGDERLTGRVAVLIAVCGASVLLFGRFRSRTVLAQWDKALAAVLVAQLGAAFAYRVITAGVVGANIGAGFMLIFAIPGVGLLLAYALERLRIFESRDRLVRGLPLRGPETPLQVAVGIGVIHFVAGMVTPWGAPVFLAAVVSIVVYQLVTAAPGDDARSITPSS